MSTTITSETVDANLATLREFRDGLRKTLTDEAHERAAKTEEMVKTAWKFADNNGIGSDLEALMEKLDLPKRPDPSCSTVDGDVLIVTVIPSTANDYHPLARMRSLYNIARSYSNQPLVFEQRMGAEQITNRMTKKRRYETAECICPSMPEMSGWFIDSTTQSEVDRLGGSISFYVDISCESEQCHHGYPPPPVDPWPEHEEYIGGSYRRDNAARLFRDWVSSANQRVTLREVPTDEEKNTSKYRVFVFPEGETGGGSYINKTVCDTFGISYRHIGRSYVQTYEGGFTGTVEAPKPERVFTRSEHERLFSAIGVSSDVVEVHQVQCSSTADILLAWEGNGGWRITSSTTSAYSVDEMYLDWRGYWVTKAELDRWGIEPQQSIDTSNDDEDDEDDEDEVWSGKAWAAEPDDEGMRECTNSDHPVGEHRHYVLARHLHLDEPVFHHLPVSDDAAEGEIDSDGDFRCWGTFGRPGACGELGCDCTEDDDDY